jgi:hypothetical protein
MTVKAIQVRKIASISALSGTLSEKCDNTARSVPRDLTIGQKGWYQEALDESWGRTFENSRHSFLP